MAASSADQTGCPRVPELTLEKNGPHVEGQIRGRLLLHCSIADPRLPVHRGFYLLAAGARQATGLQGHDPSRSGSA